MISYLKNAQKYIYLSTHACQPTRTTTKYFLTYLTPYMSTGTRTYLNTHAHKHSHTFILQLRNA